MTHPTTRQTSATRQTRQTFVARYHTIKTRRLEPLSPVKPKKTRQTFVARQTQKTLGDWNLKAYIHISYIYTNTLAGCFGDPGGSGVLAPVLPAFDLAFYRHFLLLAAFWRE